jgi:hypothetical protein
MPNMTYDKIKELIDKNAKEHKTVPSEDEWHWGLLEQQAVHAIFEYCDSIGIKPEGYNIRKILDAEDDVDDGVPPEGCQEALLNLQRRMTEPDHPDPIAVPNEVKELFAYYEKSFWPDFFR